MSSRIEEIWKGRKGKLKIRKKKNKRMLWRRTRMEIVNGFVMNVENQSRAIGNIVEIVGLSWRAWWMKMKRWMTRKIKEKTVKKMRIFKVKDNV